MTWKIVDGKPVELTAEEEAQLAADRAVWAAAEAADDAEQANAETMRQSLRARMQDALVIADALAAGTVTAAQQRQGLELALRGVVRLARLHLADLDQAT